MIVSPEKMIRCLTPRRMFLVTLFVCVPCMYLGMTRIGMEDIEHLTLLSTAPVGRNGKISNMDYLYPMIISTSLDISQAAAAAAEATAAAVATAVAQTKARNENNNSPATSTITITTSTTVNITSDNFTTAVNISTNNSTGYYPPQPATITVASTDTSLEEWRRLRNDKAIYDSWFDNGKLSDNADASGPILDFVIAGYPKCGTTAMMRTLAPVTTMPPDEDICTPMSNTVYYTYYNWAEKYGNGALKYSEEKPLRGNKCPQYLEGKGREGTLVDLGKKLPKTNIIVGIRDPVLWFQSFLNMRWLWEPTNVTLHEYVMKNRLLRDDNVDGFKCRKAKGSALCVARGRFHLSLVRLGKTPLDSGELKLLKSELFQAKRRRNNTSPILYRFPLDDDSHNIGVPNNVFLYESSQGKEEYFYQDLADFVGIDRSRLPPLDKKTHRTGIGLNDEKNTKLLKKADKTFDICSAEYDFLRQELLPISYTLREWLLRYMIPASKHRKDLVIPNTDTFVNIIERFGEDPCDRLVRSDADGEYYLKE